MQDIQEQLAQLRRRIARIDRKYADAKPATAPAPAFPPPFRPAKYFVEEYLSGEEVSTPLGTHFETERFWERHRRHGHLDISALNDLPHDLLDALSGGTTPAVPPERWAF